MKYVEECQFHKQKIQLLFYEFFLDYQTKYNTRKRNSFSLDVCVCVISLSKTTTQFLGSKI